MKHSCSDSFDRGNWIKTTVNGLSRLKCDYCGTLDDRDHWVDGVYHGPKNPEPPYPGEQKYRYWNISK